MRTILRLSLSLSPLPPATWAPTSGSAQRCCPPLAPCTLSPGTLCPNTILEGQVWDFDVTVDQQEVTHGSSHCTWLFPCLARGNAPVLGGSQGEAGGLQPCFRCAPPLGSTASAAGGQGRGRGLGDPGPSQGLPASVRISTYTFTVWAACPQAVWKFLFKQDNSLTARGVGWWCRSCHQSLQGCHRVP